MYNLFRGRHPTGVKPLLRYSIVQSEEKRARLRPREGGVVRELGAGGVQSRLEEGCVVEGEIEEPTGRDQVCQRSRAAFAPLQWSKGSLSRWRSLRKLQKLGPLDEQSNGYGHVHRFDCRPEVYSRV